MLSATIGAMPTGYLVVTSSPQPLAPRSGGDIGMYSPAPQLNLEHSAEVGNGPMMTHDLDGDRGLDALIGAKMNTATMLVSAPSGYTPSIRVEEAWIQLPGSPAIYHAELFVIGMPVASMTGVSTANATAGKGDGIYSNGTTPKGDGIYSNPGGSNAQAVSSPKLGTPIVGMQSPPAQSGFETPVNEKNEYVTGSVKPGNGAGGAGHNLEQYGDTYLNPSSVAAAISSASASEQITTRDVVSSALQSTSALDAAFQSHSSLASSTAESSHTNVDDSAGHSGDQLDFDQPSDLTTASDSTTSTKGAVEQEREAARAALNELQDIDDTAATPLDATAANGAKAATTDDAAIGDAATDAAFGKLALAEVDGGMVMLKATGDVSAAPVDYANVADAHFDAIGARVGVEATVGFYQAIDVATVDVSAVNNLPAARPAEANRVSKEAGATTSEKAALVGATAFAGAMVWTSRRRRSSESSSDRTGDKRNRRTGKLS